MPTYHDSHAKEPEAKHAGKVDDNDDDVGDEQKPNKTQDSQQTKSGSEDPQDNKDHEDQSGSTADAKNNAGDDNNDTAVEPHGRNGSAPSNILEKGIVYFFFRGRVGIDHPERVSDIARSYMVLRPIPNDAKLGEGPIGDAGNSRLIAIPKKVLPQSGKDRWIAFVEKTNASFAALKDDFLAANDYVTKTAGVRHSPAATPIGEGIYAITTTGRESHLAYMLTLPDKLGEVQTEIGLKEKGSWILSTRNPQYEAPANTALPEGPDFSQEVCALYLFAPSSCRLTDTGPQILDEFRSLRWMGTLPKHLIPNAQFLLVGESSGPDKAMQPDDKADQSEDKEQPMEELEKLEDEDTERMEHLGKDASEAIFADLDAQAKEYPKLQTTF